VQIQQLAEIHYHARLRAMETGVHRRMELLTDVAAALS
jgi:hypothetical protein